MTSSYMEGLTNLGAQLRTNLKNDCSKSSRGERCAATTTATMMAECARTMPRKRCRGGARCLHAESLATNVRVRPHACTQAHKHGCAQWVFMDVCGCVDVCVCSHAWMYGCADVWMRASACAHALLASLRSVLTPFPSSSFLLPDASTIRTCTNVHL